MSIKKVHLLLIDCQKDFCEPSGALYVPGAEDDVKRVGEMIRRLGGKLAKFVSKSISAQSTALGSGSSKLVSLSI